MAKGMAGIFSLICFLLLAPEGGGAAFASGSSFGVGVHYNIISEENEGALIDSDYLSYVVSLRQRMRDGMSVEFSLDYYPGHDGIRHIVRPTACLLWGETLNFGVGATRSYAKPEGEGGEWSDVSYLVQGGVRFPVRRDIDINIDAFYFMQKFSELKDIDFDSLTFAARLFFRF